ncbi:MAG: M56 family metallopeptidase [Gemmatimonadetes bacterium]|nr:M56 family metallopeptidase [Gemmatimonadota bacterium]MYB98024.1 M56 family metallopeptidase [Gemmatimonadota bacterium]MYI46968.1 M56 family metallopeptidase [Gemmatimonadota bacterium]
MSELLLQIGATKLAVSLVLAGMAWTVQRRVGRPGVSYHIWLLVLVVLLVPAVVSLPVLPAEPAGMAVTPASGSADVVLAETTSGPSRRLGPGALAGPALAITWLLGTIGLLGWSMVRTTRFRRVLAKASTRAAAQIQHEAAAIGRRLGLARVPEVLTADARVTPLVWWNGGKVRVLIPAWILTDLTRDELRAILAHELAHVRRRDHLVRWLEWFACSVFWWNPVAWWARRQLRIAEESCCDRLALEVAGSSPRSYANALLRVVAKASRSPGFHPPLPATAADGAGRTETLERRLRMIVSTDIRSPARRRVRAATWMAVLFALPFGLVYCDRPTTPMAGEEEPATEAETLESSVGSLDGDIADILTRREEEIHQSILERVESGELDEHRGRLLSAYVSGSKAGILIHYEGRELTIKEKRTAVEKLSASVDWDGLGRAAAFDKLDLERARSIAQLITELQEQEAEFLRRLRELRETRLLVPKRPEFPIIKRQLERERPSHAQ